MTKLLKISIALVLAIQIILFVYGSVYLQALSGQMDSDFNAYYVRKDDLMIQQQKLQTLILELNNTIELEKNNAQNLSTQLAETKVLQELVNETQTIIAAPVATAVVQPKPRTTRAS